MNSYQKRQALKNMLLMEAEALAEKRAKEYTQEDYNALLKPKPVLRLAANNGVLVDESRSASKKIGRYV